MTSLTLSRRVSKDIITSERFLLEVRTFGLNFGVLIWTVDTLDVGVICDDPDFGE